MPDEGIYRVTSRLGLFIWPSLQMRRRFAVHFSWTIALTTALVAHPNPLQAMADEDKTTEVGTLSTEVERVPRRSVETGTTIEIEDAAFSIPTAIQNKCGGCHNESTQKGELNLLQSDGILRGGESGEPLLHEDLEQSRLWQVIQHDEMPPPSEIDLTGLEKEQIKTWILQNHKTLNPATKATLPSSIHDVLPTLLLRCASCHGAQRQDGGLDIRTYDSIMSGGDSGLALEVGDSASSLMIQRIEQEQCPPRELLLKFFVRRPSETEVHLLRDWIDAGAPIGEVRADVATREADPLVTQEDRQHWAFQTPQWPIAGQSVDDFVQATLQKNQLELGPNADRDTLIRRAFFDLIGLPPSVDQWKQWRESTAPNWYELMIDELLASPRYGERWGRYWLDLAGYADSEGGISADPLRPVAWKYRDYVIRAFNRDLPYDEFLIEQIAGDELTDHAMISELTADQVDQLIATGFLRMGIDETGSRTMNFVPERLKVISDAITIVSSGLMGLTMECARCHSHKYDPIPQRDYYRLKAIFQGAFDEHNWKSFKQRKLSIGTNEQRVALQETNPPLQKRKKAVQAEHKRMQDALVVAILRAAFPDQSEKDRNGTLAALGIADNQRTLPQRMLVEKLQTAQNLPEIQEATEILSIQKKISRLEDQMESIDRSMVPSLTIRALWDEGHPSPTYILRRGEHTQASRWVGPGVPSVLTDGKTPFYFENPFPNGSKKTGRRLAFAKWLTNKNHPTTARTFVNRVWNHHFGKGLVSTVENFGTMGSKPTHPELLDWLALKFMSDGWSIKALHRTIMTSNTYKQSSEVSPLLKRLDPENQYYSRMPMRRLDAEALRDSILFVSGRLDLKAGGIPDPVSVGPEGEVNVKPLPNQKWRRSIYAQYRRTEIPTLLDTFDYPQMGPNCFERTVSTVSPQALLLLNNQQIRELSKSLAAEIEKETTIAVTDPATHPATQELTDDWNEKIELTYQKVMSRLPTPNEQEIGRESLTALSKQWNGDEQKAFETYCHVLINSASFLYID